jgi:hypothetical protein
MVDWTERTIRSRRKVRQGTVCTDVHAWHCGAWRGAPYTVYNLGPDGSTLGVPTAPILVSRRPQLGVPTPPILVCRRPQSWRPDGLDLRMRTFSCPTPSPYNIEDSRFLGATFMERSTVPPGKLPRHREFHSFYPMHARRWREGPLVGLHTDQGSFSNRDCSQA